MGAKSSKSGIPRYPPNDYHYPPNPSRFSSYSPSTSQSNNVNDPRNRYRFIPDNYTSIEQVTEALAEAGLESSNLIVGIDFTKSNEWSGKVSFNRRCLHDMVHSPNPYEQAISIIGRTLSKFDDDGLIPCFGFGDVSTRDKNVFRFYPDHRPCLGFEEALHRYKELVPHVFLGGPTSFAPIIETAIGIVDESGGQYHVLLIIADGQVTRSVDTPPGRYSTQEMETIDAIVKASEYPLSIVLVGVGDGPWDLMQNFDDCIPARAFDNFQFVNFTEIVSANTSAERMEAKFALSALMEVPSQYKATLDLQLLGKRRGFSGRTSLPPPIRNGVAVQRNHYSPQSENYRSGLATWERSPETQACAVCFSSRANLAFTCGHQTCSFCGEDAAYCAVCGLLIENKIKLY